jgi:hypothetical protein
MRERIESAARMRSSTDMRLKRSNSARREAFAEMLALGFCANADALTFTNLT